MLMSADLTLKVSMNVKQLNLALKGGRGHGAFAWGALDGLLEDARIAVDGMSATSAGSMDPVVYA